MTKNNKAFTLVEMLFVVVIAIIFLGFSVYKLSGLKTTGLQKGATGFLVDMTNAMESIERDFALQGKDLKACLIDSHTGNNENIEITPNGTVHGETLDWTTLEEEAQGKTVTEFLAEGEDACTEERFIAALFLYHYLELGIATVGDYKYYINLGFPIPAACGRSDGDTTGQVLAYMCKRSNRGEEGPTVNGSPAWSTQGETRCSISKADSMSYMSNGLITTRMDTGSKPALDTSKNLTNPCGSETSGFTCKQKKCELTQSSSGPLTCSQLPGYNPEDIPLSRPIYQGNCSGTGGSSSCTTKCVMDCTLRNNTQSDEKGRNTFLWVIINGQSRQISCYEYWHSYGSEAY